MRRSSLDFLFFIMPMSFVFRVSVVYSIAISLTHSLQVCILSLLFDCLLLHWTFGICYLLAGYGTEGGTGGRDITSICFLFKFCIRCQGSWWQGCIKCFCGCKSELMRAEKNTKKSKERDGREGKGEGEEIAAVASCNAFNLYARPGKPSKYNNNKIKKGKEKE